MASINDHLEELDAFQIEPPIEAEQFLDLTYDNFVSETYQYSFNTEFRPLAKFLIVSLEDYIPLGLEKEDVDVMVFFLCHLAERRALVLLDGFLDSPQFYEEVRNWGTSNGIETNFLFLPIVKNVMEKTVKEIKEVVSKARLDPFDLYFVGWRKNDMIIGVV